MFQNIALMFPVGLLYDMVGDLFNGGVENGRKEFFCIGGIVCILLILLTTWFQYNATYFATYTESSVRRISLAEKLRRIPLSFFEKKDLADLTSTIMADCTFLEQSFSHFIPELFGSIISALLIAISLFVLDWRMALAALLVLPVSFAIVWFSGKVQEKMSQKSMEAKMVCVDGIQECIETVRDLKASNAEKEYLKGLETKIDAVERRAVISEFGTVAFVVFASLILKLGIATVALAGAIFLVDGSLDILTFFLYLLVASRLYDPLQSALQNLAAVISTRTNIGRMNEILEHPVQMGKNNLTNNGCEIVFDHVGFAYDNGETVLRDERQRISIARAFLKNAPIILLDEATASLDVENETLIQSALSRLIKDKTVLVIAHRMRTVAGADKIAVLADGKVAEQGTNKELMQTNGIYRHMVELQTKSQGWSLA